MSKRTFSLLSVILILSLFLAACASPSGGTGSSTSGSGGTIRVASQSPLSGGQSAIGVDIKNGAEFNPLTVAAVGLPPACLFKTAGS